MASTPQPSSNEEEKLLGPNSSPSSSDNNKNNNYGAAATAATLLGSSPNPTRNSCCDENGNCENAPSRKRAFPGTASSAASSSSTNNLVRFFGDLFQTQNSRTSVAACCASGTCVYTQKFLYSGPDNNPEQQKQQLPRRPSERSLSEESIGSYNNPSTPIRSRTNSADSSSLSGQSPSSLTQQQLGSTTPPPQMDPTVAQTIVRSTLHCTGICCSSEVPELLEILQPTEGIAEVKVNVPLKQIILDHDCRVISATQIAKLLEEELFPSKVERDGGASLPSFVRSTFHSKGLCCSSEVPLIVSILQPYEGVSDIKFNVPLKQIIVEHNSKVISAAQLASLLTKEDFPTSIVADGGTKTVGVEGRSKFHVGGICCASEIPAIKTILEPKEGIKGLIVNVATKMVYVDHSANIISADTIADSLNDNGFDAVVKYDCYKDAGGFLSSFVMSKFSIESSSPTMAKDLKTYLKTYNEDHIEGYQLEKSSMIISIIHNPLLISADELSRSMLEATEIKTSVEKDGNDGKVWNFSESIEEDDALDDPAEELGNGIQPAVAICGVFWILSMLSYVGGSWRVFSYLGLLSVGIGIPPIAKKAYRTACRGMIDTNVLMFLAVFGAVCLGQFNEAAAVTFLFSLSEWLEHRATSRANAALTSIVKLKPERANIIQPKTKELVVVPATSVPVGAMVAVKSGDKIPCDGIIVEGNSTVDESSLTGESRPVKKGPRDEVSGGTVNSGNTQIVVQTTRTSDDSAVSRLIRLVEEAQANRSETEKIIDSFAKVYTPVVVLSALAMCTISWFWGPAVGRDWTSRGLSLVVIACPCALVISTPISYVAGLAATAQNGVLVKGGAHLEALGQLKHVCFDKTGTLTVGEFKLLKLSMIGSKLGRQEVLQNLALMEERATHPLAKSLVDGIKAEGVTVPPTLVVKDHTVLAGEGAEGTVNGKKVYVGNERLFRRLGIFDTIPLAQKEKIESWEATGGTVGFMSIGDEGIVCTYCVADAPRPETMQVIKELKDMGMSVTMLTGDKRRTALSIGKLIGMESENIKSELLPEEKLARISELKEETGASNPLLALFFAKPRLVLMCGDGVNDAPSLVVANVGVAMGAGAALAMETADVTLMDSQLTKLTYSIKMGRLVIQKIRENVVFSILVKLVVLGLTVTNHVGLWAAIGSDVGSMIVVTLNGMSLLPKDEKKMHTTTTKMETQIV